MKVLSIKKHNDFLLLETSKGKIMLQPCSNNIVRVVYTLEEKLSIKESLMIVKANRKAVDWDVVETELTVKLILEEISIQISRQTGTFTYFDSKGNLLVKEPDRGGKYLVAIDVEKTIFDKNAEIKSGQNVDGMRAQVEEFTKVIDRKAYHGKLEFEWVEGEAIYGLGSHEEGIFNLRGHHQYLYQQNMKAVVPVLVSTKGYGILMDNYSLMTFHDDEYGSYIWSEVSNEMDYYFIYGPEFDDIVAGYRVLTGCVPMLPKWAFGYAQSKETYNSQEELISVVEEYRARNIPLDLIVQDWKSWPGELWGQKTLDEERFPNPKGMMSRLHEMNAKLMISIWPIMKAGGENHREMKEKGCLLGNQATYNAFDKKARELYWKHANEGLFSHGIDAWWCDCTEPFEADWNGELKPEPEERLQINAGEAKKYMDPEYINAFSLLHSKGIYEGQRKVTEEKRVVNLTRSSYAGQHRYSTVTWSGDIAANWKTMADQIPGGLNFCVTGEPYWTVDIGAFFVKRKEDLWFWNGDYDYGCDDLGYRELYVRWFQYGAFLPLFRSHGTDTPREVWRFGEPGSVFYDTLVGFIKLRYRLIPYIYSIAGKVTHESYTMMRLLPFEFRNDIKTFNISDQYMFGNAFLVNPVTKPMYYENGSRELTEVEKVRPVYLPEGYHWYNFWTGECFEGGQTIDAKAALEIMPLFVKAGAIVPMGPVVQHTGEMPNAPVEIRIYPGADGKFTIYEDEGDSYRYETGLFSTINIQWEDNSRLLVFGRRKGEFPGMADYRDFNIIIVRSGYGVGIEETKQPDMTVKYNGEKLTVSI